jgi:hypothetical protein
MTEARHALIVAKKKSLDFAKGALKAVTGGPDACEYFSTDPKISISVNNYSGDIALTLDQKISIQEMVVQAYAVVVERLQKEYDAL